MQAVHGKHQENEEIRNHHCQVEGIGVINAAERLVGDFMPVMANGILLCEINRE
jgi:hypothetical protein